MGAETSTTTFIVTPVGKIPHDILYVTSRNDSVGSAHFDYPVHSCRSYQRYRNCMSCPACDSAHIRSQPDLADPLSRRSHRYTRQIDEPLIMPVILGVLVRLGIYVRHPVARTHSYPK